MVKWLSRLALNQEFPVRSWVGLSLLKIFVNIASFCYDAKINRSCASGENHSLLLSYGWCNVFQEFFNSKMSHQSNIIRKIYRIRHWTLTSHLGSDYKKPSVLIWFFEFLLNRAYNSFVCFLSFQWMVRNEKYGERWGIIIVSSNSLVTAGIPIKVVLLMDYSTKLKLALHA